MTVRKKPTKNPPVRKDGLCARFPKCKKKRLPNVRNSGIEYKAFEDPFCSTECCREHWGVSLAPARPLPAK